MISSVSQAVPPLSDDTARRLVQQGITATYNHSIPTGSISLLEPALDPTAKPEEHVYGSKYLKTLEAYRKTGLVALKPHPFFNPTMGGEIDVSITERTKQLAVGRLGNGDYLISMGVVTIGTIIGNSEYKDATRPSDEYRLILAVYDFSPTAVGREMFQNYGLTLQRQYKCRALVKYDPFQATYVFVRHDWGYLDKDGFETARIK